MIEDLKIQREHGVENLTKKALKGLQQGDRLISKHWHIYDRVVVIHGEPFVWTYLGFYPVKDVLQWKLDNQRRRRHESNRRNKEAR